MALNETRVLRLLRISRTVSDLNKAVAFYRDALDFCVVNEVTHNPDIWGKLMGIAITEARSVFMRLGQQELELFCLHPLGQAYPSGSRSNDSWFQHIAIVVNDIQAAYEKLHQFAFQSITEGNPQRLPPSSGAVIAYKFRDPDGHPLELIHFPAGTGNDLWQGHSELFCGIDHSAITIENMKQSIDFYNRLLGLEVRAHSLNAGVKQARLDAVDHPQVEVTALQPSCNEPPHLELLSYLQPAGRVMPAGLKSNDVAADRIVFLVSNLPGLVEILETEHLGTIISGYVTLNDSQLAVLALDPTGHFLMLVEDGVNDCDRNHQ